MDRDFKPERSLVGWFEPNRLPGHNGGGCVLVDDWRLPVPNEQDGIAVEACHVALAPDTTRQIHRDGNLVLAHVVRKRALEGLRTFCSYDHFSWLGPDA